MKLHLAVSDPITNQGHHQVIIVDDWAAAKARGQEQAQKWAEAHRINFDDVEVKLTPTATGGKDG